MSTQCEEDEWQLWWDARKAALEGILGPADDQVFHALVPLYLGGDADVLRFHPAGMGVTYVTSDLIGDDSQLQNDLGNYELMICLRAGDDWAPNLISRLARYTLEAKLTPWETMDIGPALPEGSALTALAFIPHARLKVRGRDCGLLLCLGMTSEEFQMYHERGPEFTLDRLKQHGVFPFSELRRRAVSLE
jgi:Suppressor of fused protein (SUFU)